MNHTTTPRQVELSLDGGSTWEPVTLPTNSAPFHQIVILGRATYEEQQAMYRLKEQ